MVQTMSSSSSDAGDDFGAPLNDIDMENDFSMEDNEDMEVDDREYPVGEEVNASAQTEMQVNVTEDGGLKKKVLEAGTGTARPRANDVVNVHYVGTLEDGTKFDSSRDRGDPFSFTLGKGQVIKGWDKGVATMRKGEKAILICRSDYGYGDAGSPPKIPGGATLHFEVELLSWVDSRDISEEKDGSMVKEVKSKGSAYKKPNPEDEVVARITIRPRGSEEVVYENASAIFTVSEGFLMPAVGAAVRTMGLHECAVVQAASRHCFGSAGGLEGKVPADADLDIEIELKEMHPVDDLGCPGKIRRKILKQGDGYQTPGEMAPVRVRYTVKTADGAVLDDSHAAEGQEFAFVTDEGETIAALDKACCKMKKGEVAELRAHADMAWGSEGHTFSGGARVEGGQEVVLEVEMVEFEKQKGSWEMEDAEKVEFAESRKANGNGWFKKGHFERAIARYKKAADAIEFDSGFPDDLKKKAREVAVACLTNQAACFMKMGNHAEALKTAGKALKKDPASTKALFRRAQAHAGNKDYDMAERDLKEAMLREPENKDLATELKRVRAAAKQADQKQKAMWAKAFA